MSPPAEDMARAWNRLCPHEDTVTEAVLNDLVERWSEAQPREDGVVGERVAVHLVRRQVGDPPLVGLPAEVGA